MRKYKDVILFFLFVIGFIDIIFMVGTAGALETDAITEVEAVRQMIKCGAVMTLCLIGDSVVKRVAR